MVVSEGFLDLDTVSDTDRLLNQKDEPGHEVGNHILQPQADANAHRAAKHDQGVEIYSQGLKADEEASKKKEVGCKPPQCKLLRRRYWKAMEEPREQYPLHQPRKRHKQKYKDDNFEKKERRYRQGTNLEKHMRGGVVPVD